MKYIEELKSGETFSLEDNVFVMTCDFKKSGQRLAISLKTGQSKWFTSDKSVNVEPTYTLDKEQNICPIFIYPKENNE